MPEYYDSWSASKKKKNPDRQPHSRESFSTRPRPQPQPTLHPCNISVDLTSNTSSSSSSSPSTTFVAVPPSTSFAPRFSSSPTLQPQQQSPVSSAHYTNTILNPRATVQSWRFSRNIFDPKKSLATYETDFDDVDEDDEDNDINNEDENDDGESSDLPSSINDHNNIHQPSSIKILPRFPTMPPKTYLSSSAPSSSSQPHPPTQRRSMFWPDFHLKKSNQTKKRGEQSEQQQYEHIEQLESSREDDGDPFLNVQPLNVMAQSSPALSTMDTSSALDHPVSVSKNLHLQSMTRHDSTGQDTLVHASKSASRRQRPWSQVIWESPSVLGEPSQPQQYHKQLQQSRPARVDFRNSLTMDARLDGGAYPVLTKDLFTQLTPTTHLDKERVVSKSVRIQIDTDSSPRTNNNNRRVLTKPIISSVGGIRSLSGGNNNHRNNLLPILPGRRDLSHSKKHNNRLSLGSGFYASIEPVSLSSATPSTPKTKRNLVRLPARPQSVLIPTGAAAGQTGAKSAGPTLQPISTDPSTSKRRRHKSQQLEMRKEESLASVPIPWRQLAPLTSQDNAKTFHGLGSTSTAPLSALMNSGGTQITTLDGSTSCSALPSSHTNTLSRQLKQQQTHSPKQQRQSIQGSRQSGRQTASPPLTPTSSSANHRQSVYTPSKFLPTLLESSSSFFFKKPRPAFAASARSSNRDPTDSDLSDTASSSSLTSPSSFRSSSSKAKPRTTKRSPPPAASTKNRSEFSPSSSSPFRHTLHFHNRKPALVQTPRSRQTLMTTSSFFHTHSSTEEPPSTSFTASVNNTTTTTNSIQTPVSSSTSSSAAPLTITTTTSSWKRDSSSILFPFSLVSYEIGGVIGGPPRNLIGNGSSSQLPAPGTTLPSGIIVSTEVPLSLAIVPHPDSPPTLAMPTISFAPSEESPIEGQVTTSETFIGHRGYQGEPDGDQKDEDRHDDDDDDYEDEGGEYYNPDEGGDEEMMKESQYFEKSHVAVYEINARWGSRLTMVLVTLGGLVSVLGGGLCVEYHCQDLQFCADDYHAHGNWCGPSGIDGAPYMLTVGLSMCIFGLYSLTYLRIPTSRLVGYSEIEQFF